MEKYFFVILFIIFFSVSLICGNNTSSFSAVIVEINGKVEISYIADVWIPANVGSQLSQNEMIRTGANSSARLRFGDQSYSSVGENTLLRLEQMKSETREVRRGRFRRTQEVPARDIKLQVLNGNVFSKVQPDDEEIIYQVSTPVAVAGIRGTTFDVEHLDKTKVSVIQGIVEVFNLDNPDQIIQLFENQQSLIEERKVPTPPATISEEDRARFNRIVETITVEETLVPEFIDQTYNLINETDNSKEYQYTVRIKNLDAQTAKVYLILYRESGEEFKTVEMNIISGQRQDIRGTKTYRINVTFTETGNFLHRYKIEN